MLFAFWGAPFPLGPQHRSQHEERHSSRMDAVIDGAPIANGIFKDNNLDEGKSRGSNFSCSDMIRIHLLEEKAFVWSYADARQIREEHRIVGVLAGALPRKPRQNVRLGLPLELLPEEARLLLEKGLATLVRSPASQPFADGENQDALLPEKVVAYEKELEENYQEQRRLCADQRKAMLESLAGHITQSRAKKWQRKEGGGGGGGDPLVQPAESGSSFVLPRESMMIQLPTERTEITQEETVDWHVASQLWPYAGQELHEMRYSVFRDLWERGYYVTTGSKFGGDFLVYPGDPMRFHAHYIVLCFPKDVPISLCDIVSAGRLGTNVKKTVLLCSVDQEGTIAYTSLQWSGMQ